MSSNQRSLDEIVRELSPDAQAKVREYVESLREGTNGQGKRLGQNWAGALSDYRDKYTSLELQKLASDWRGD